MRRLPASVVGRRLTHADIGIYYSRGPRVHDVGCLQCNCRGAPSRDPGRADRRREGGRGDRGRPLAVSASGLEAPPGAQRGGTRPVPGGGASSAVQPGTRAPPAAAPVVGQVRAGMERATGSAGRLPQGTTTTRRAAVTPNRHGSSVIKYPTELEIVTTREFEAPIGLVFDVLTKPEHVSKWFAPFTCEVTKCSI